MESLKGRIAYLILVSAMLLIFFGGYWVRGWVEHSNITHDTTAVAVKPPDPSTTTNIPGKPVPSKIVYRDRVVLDSTALWESAWLQNENARLTEQLDALMADKDSLRDKLDILLAPHTGTSAFRFDLLDGKGWLAGNAEQGYAPMSEAFGLKLTPTELYLPQITITKHPAWWVKPATFIGGAATAYFITEKNSTGALIAGGASSILLFVEF